ncbi:MAG TPA: hypothetical protein EYP87_03715 [Flavobacteriaceae bacterium]|nr:hypothetical protein [Flavobacteriaceae bacterium]
MKKKYLLWYLSFVLLFSCKTKVEIIEPDRTYIPKHSNFDASKVNNNDANIFYFIRHAEEKNDDGENPHLSEKGLKKVDLYTKYFTDKKVDTIYSTNLNRTFETAEIIAKKKVVGVGFYDPLILDYKKFFENNKNNSIVVVGHANTTPNFINKILGNQKYSQIMQDNYSDIFRLVIVKGKVVFDEILTIENEIQKIEDAKLSPKELKKVLKERRKAKK